MASMSGYMPAAGGRSGDGRIEATSTSDPIGGRWPGTLSIPAIDPNAKPITVIIPVVRDPSKAPAPGSDRGITVVVGVEFTAVALFGTQLNAGAAVGLFSGCGPDGARFASVGAGAGVDASLTVFGGIVRGGPANLEGVAANINTTVFGVTYQA